MLAPAVPVSAAPVLPRLPATADQDEPVARPTRWLARVEFGLGLLITLASVYFHALQSQVAGGLWRDEAVSVQVANLSTLGQTWRYLEFDSYPVLFHLLLRTWSTFFSAGDTSMRIFGLLIGLSLLAAFWIAGRALGIRVPLFALGLLALNPIFIRYGDSLRAYGLGCTLAILSLAAIWTVARAAHVDWRRLLWAMLAALFSVQCLYHNAALLLAGCVAGALVALWNRRVAVATATLAIGVPAAISLLPYLPIIHRTQRWSFLLQFPVTPRWLWTRLAMVTGSPIPVGVWMWTGLFAGSVILTGCLLFVAWKRRERLPADAPVRVFAGLALVAATVVYGGFLSVVGYVTQPWYYLAFLAFAAMCLDAAFGQTDAAVGWRWCRVAAVGVFGLCVIRPTFASLQTRNTNVDFIAANLNANVRPTDLVLVNRWECAISLNRYYRGSARLLTVPPIADHIVHRYDLLLDQLQMADPLEPVIAAMHATLQAGGRVWMVGPCFRLQPRLPARTGSPVTTDVQGQRSSSLMLEDWMLKVNDDLARHSVHGAGVPVSGVLAVSDFENLPLHWFSGWREERVPPSATAEIGSHRPQ